MTNEEREEFNSWFRRLMLSSAVDKHLQPHHPLGSCNLRDVLRDKTAKDAIRDAWERIIINEEKARD